MVKNLAARIAELMPTERVPVGIVVVDHGSRREESNEMLLAVVAMFRRRAAMAIVEPAHMELAEPTVADAFARCVEQGARTIVVFPYFLAPGRHWSSDIPRLAAEAAAQHPGIAHLVTAPLGIHGLIAEVMAERIATCMQHHAADGETCEMCDDEARCKLR